MPPDLKGDQLAAIDAMERFAADRSGARSFMTLHGLAGTGKTFTLGRFAALHPEATLCAPTGKAAAVLRGRTGREARTIHSVIYDFRGNVEDEETGQKRPVFEAKDDAGIRGDLVLLDEASMAGTRLARDLLDAGARVIACGDPGQLPPVADEQFFSRPDRTLTEIHRQALDSAVIRQAHRVRVGRPYADDGPDFRVAARASDDDLRAADVALCWRNGTRRALTGRRRAALGLSGPVLRAGEPVMCLRNDYRLGIFNGEVYPLARDRAPGEDAALLVDGRAVELLNAVVELFDPSFDELRHEEEWTPLSLAYAVTCHKAQGSEWESVLVVDEVTGAERPQWLYTAITRASKRVLVASPRR